MKDFFVSYNAHDRDWAVWIAWELEEAGYSVLIQAWDFVGNWVLQMDRAMRGTKQTIAVLSPNYLQALYTQTEWANALQRDPTGMKDVLIPFRVAKCEPDGYLAQIVYTDLTDLSEDQARDQLLKRVSGQRGKPALAPGFPRGAGAPSAARSVPRRPPYPAKDEDLQRLQRFRVIARVARSLCITHRGLATRRRASTWPTVLSAE
jgi:TIR domain